MIDLVKNRKIGVSANIALEFVSGGTDPHSDGLHLVEVSKALIEPRVL